MQNITILILFAALVFSSCGGSNESSTVNQATSEAPAAAEAEAKVWQYGENKDEMSNDVTKYAACSSTNQIEFEFPYQGGSDFALALIDNGKEQNVKLSVSKGQFMPSIMGENSVRVKFDDEEPVNFTYVGTSDGSSDVIFLNNEKKFIAKLKAAKKLMIEAEFFNAGRQVIKFDVQGLEWAQNS